MKAVNSRQQLFFKALACLAQLVALFPFAVIYEALALETLVVWHFAVIYAVWIVFGVAGWLAGLLYEALGKRRLPKKLVPIVNFLCRACVVLPLAAFVLVGIQLNIHGGAFVYLLPAAVLSYYGGERSVGKSYSDVFTKAWFALFVTAALLVTVILAITKATEVSSAAAWLMCPAFGVVVLLSAVLANQTNIDSRTRQRSYGKAVLPAGLRRYNTVLVMVIFALTLGVFLFSRQLGALIRAVISAVMKAVVYLMEQMSKLFRPVQDEAPPVEGGEPIFNPVSETHAADIVTALLIVALVALVIVFRKQIAAAIKGFFAPLFRSRRRESDMPFADEITSSTAKQASARERRKAERDLARRYSRETVPERKFRLGYALFLAELNNTPHKPCPSDTTDDHREKGEAAFGEDPAAITETYNNVRYGDIPPTAEELAVQSDFLGRIK